MSEIIKGFKVTNENLTCRSFQYEVGKVFKHTGEVSLCNGGFHFCIVAAHCFNYYDFNPKNRVFEIEASGTVVHGDDKSVCSEIKLIRELAWEEVLKIVNTGVGNSGHSNSGNWNSGDRNSGYRNSGYRNSGDSNSGDSNSGDWNSGYRNSGDSNSGDWNSGNWNSGYRNSGDSNSGYRNSGDSNSGYRNSGNWNSGYRNSGDSNSGYRNSGAFCTDKDPVLFLFNKPSKMSVKEWENHPACELMYRIDTTIWVTWSMMTEDEKKANPKYELSEGYTKAIPIKEAWKNFWHNLTDDNKKLFTSLENFSWEIFTEITGITPTN